MRKDREQATLLRKSGMTYSSIIARMGVPRSTLSKWFKDQNWSNQIATEAARKVQKDSAIRFAVINTVRAGRLGSAYKQARQDAILDFEDLRYHPLFMAGIISYWMHGDMTNRNRVCFSSADPGKVNLFKSFLMKICGIERPKVWVTLRKGNLIFLAESYWMDKCGLDKALFTKTLVSGGRSVENIRKIGNNHGVCNMAVNSAYLKNKILKWVELLKEDLETEGYLQGQFENNAGIV